ncbi:TetR family transcriptional regulator [Microbacterium sp. NPDC019599]|uniref:TetR family transcriptional regulator n=1 Tax=Microbacterium sp. NPDC019599 TaxID=3154690 RepID=UPI003410A3F2
MDTTRGTMRSVRAERTRSAIVTAAHDAFVSRGYRATSLREISAAAGVSHPGLLRHFATKGELLAAVMATLQLDNEELVLEHLAHDDGGMLDFGAIARRNAAVPGYLPLFAALTGEASTSHHPAHGLMRERYARLVELSTQLLRDAMDHGVVASDRDPHAEAIRIAAAWDGLQLLSQYLPGRVDVATSLEVYQEALALPRGWREQGDSRRAVPPASFPRVAEVGADEGVPMLGYRVGRDRRARIVADAMALFARDGYGDTSLQDIAAAVGVSKSTLLHHYPTKETLLSAVLAERDRGIPRPLPAPARAADVLRGMPAGARLNAEQAPGLIEVYAVLSCEAVPTSHPAHGYFAERFAGALDLLTALLRAAQADGDLPRHRDPAFEAVWLVALWDGLQYQWLYDRDGVDVAAHLASHLEDLLPG